MAKKLLQDYRTGEPVDDVFLLTRRELKTAKSGSYYLALTLSDSSGTMESRMWDASPALYEALDEGAFVHVKGKAETYNNQRQISIKVITIADPADFQLSDFLPRCERSSKEMLAELKQILAQIEDKDYKRICDAFLSDKEFAEAFCTAPAAVRYHHAYLGGLLDHTLQIERLALALLPHYPLLRKDLLLTAVFFHDMGKVREMRFDRAFTHTDEGNLIGHVVLGALMVAEKARALDDFPDDKLNLLCHCILSHHGEYIFGSPKLPMVPEAFAVHYLDNLDAKLKDFLTTIEDDSQSKSNWTEFVPQFQRRLFKG